MLAQIESGNTAADHGHQARNKPLPEFSERLRPLQFAGDFGGAGLNPTLLVHRRSALFEDIDGTGEFPGFIGRRRKRNGLRVVTLRDGLDRGFQRLDWVDDAAERQETEHAGNRQGQTDRDEQIAPRFFDGFDGRLARRRG